MGTLSTHEFACNLLSECKYGELDEFIKPYVRTKTSWAEAYLGSAIKFEQGSRKILLSHGSILAFSLYLSYRIYQSFACSEHGRLLIVMNSRVEVAVS